MGERPVAWCAVTVAVGAGSLRRSSDGCDGTEGILGACFVVVRGRRIVIDRRMHRCWGCERLLLLRRGWDWRVRVIGRHRTLVCETGRGGRGDEWH